MREKRAEAVQFAHYILHPHTWSLQPVCYLEDLFVAPEARRLGRGRHLIERLVTMGRDHGWRRVYWHTHTTTFRAARSMTG
jgi:GNAT superfamily N-acetyltransferase